MKKFYKCPICGQEFCLKGNRYCKEGGDIYCHGTADIAHTKVKMEYAGRTYAELKAFRKDKDDGKEANGAS